jgi:hypothetical protein
MNELTALVLSLPTHNSTVRMRVWRALKESGCGVLRDGVYVLPAGSGNGVLGEIESDIRSAGGFAMTLELKPRTAEQLSDLRKLFDRSADYGALLQKIDAAAGGLPRLGARKGGTQLRRLRGVFDRISKIDFFPGQARLQAAEAIDSLERRFQEAYSGGEPRSSKRRLRGLDPARYQKRLWATRKDLWVDRLASAWLIKRFIDRNAKFVWIARFCSGSRGRPSARARQSASTTTAPSSPTRTTWLRSRSCEGASAWTAIRLSWRSAPRCIFSTSAVFRPRTRRDWKRCSRESSRRRATTTSCSRRRCGFWISSIRRTLTGPQAGVPADSPHHRRAQRVQVLLLHRLRRR